MYRISCVYVQKCILVICRMLFNHLNFRTFGQISIKYFKNIFNCRHGFTESKDAKKKKKKKNEKYKRNYSVSNVEN